MRRIRSCDPNGTVYSYEHKENLPSNSLDFYIALNMYTIQENTTILNPNLNVGMTAMTSSRHFSTLEFHDARSSHPAHDDDPDDANLHRGATCVFTHRVFFLAWRRLHPARGTVGVHQRGDRGEQEKGGCQDGERDELPARGSTAAGHSDDGTGDVWVRRERGKNELKSGLCRIFLVARRRRNLRKGSSRARWCVFFFFRDSTRKRNSKKRTHVDTKKYFGIYILTRPCSSHSQGWKSEKESTLRSKSFTLSRFNWIVMRMYAC
jgi:hypothetical protein